MKKNTVPCCLCSETRRRVTLPAQARSTYVAEAVFWRWACSSVSRARSRQRFQSVRRRRRRRLIASGGCGGRRCFLLVAITVALRGFDCVLRCCRLLRWATTTTSRCGPARRHCPAQQRKRMASGWAGPLLTRNGLAGVTEGTARHLTEVEGRLRLRARGGRHCGVLWASTEVSGDRRLR